MGILIVSLSFLQASVWKNLEGEQLWGYVETQLSTKVPDYIKKLLQFNGFDNVFAMSKFDDSHLSSIETFAREDLPDLIPKEDYPLYFGMLFAKNVNKFKFLPGHKVLLKGIAQTLESNLNETTTVNSKKQQKKIVNKIDPTSKPATSEDIGKKNYSKFNELVFQKLHVYTNILLNK